MSGPPLPSLDVLGVPEQRAPGSEQQFVRVVGSGRPMAGKRFEPVAEAALLPDVVELARGLARRSEMIAITEFVGPFGVADVIALVPARERLERRLALDIAPLLYEADTAVVTVLTAQRGRSVDEIADRLGWSINSVQRRLPLLLRKGAVARTQRGTYIRHPDLVPVGRLHAFEAKVSDWRGGLVQARRYRLWADTATVVLPRIPASRANVHQEITGHGIGLGVSGAWVRRPRAFAHSRERRLLASELAIAALS